jgi:peptide/nickel transport system substrate-binding protein
MRVPRRAGLGTALIALMLAACGGPGTGGGSAGSATSGGIHNPSDARGGTLRYSNSGDWDSLDPADTYTPTPGTSSGTTGGPW